MSTGQILLFLTIVAGSLLEGEVVIVGFAVLAAAASFPLHPAAVAGGAILGTQIGDQAMYWIGRLAKDPSELRFGGRRLLDPARRAHLERFFRDHGTKTVFALRYAFGLRTVGYLSAGAMRMSWRRFFLADLAATITWVALLVGLGYVAGRPFLRLVEGGAGLFLALPVTAFVVGLVIWFQRRFERG